MLFLNMYFCLLKCVFKGGKIRDEGKYFLDWIEAMKNEETINEITKKEKAEKLESALNALISAVQVRIDSSLDFQYKYLERERFELACLFFFIFLSK